jgi:signal transduction histidine kinase
VGTTAGLSRYNQRKNNFTRFIDIFGSNNISGILDDENDRLWISTHSGLSMFDPSTQKVINFTYYDGLGADEYNPGAMYCNKSNELFFGGIKGIDAFNPDKLKFNTEPPEVYIDGLRIFNKSLSADSTGYKIHKNLRLVKKITLHHNENIITIYFKALNYINPELNRYSYKLEGLDKKWHDPGLVREATYTNLSPGKYTFRVIASNNDGIWNTEGARLQIDVVPPWYATIVAIIVFMLILGALVLWVVFKRTASLEKQRLTLEQTVKEKTFELSVKNELLKKHAEHLDEVNKLLVERQNQLEQQSEELINQSDNLARANAELERLNATKNRLFSIIGHDMSTPFSAIIGLTELFETEYKSLDDQQKHEYIRDINISSHRLYNLLQNLLLWARSQVMGISCNPAVVNMSEVINETVELRRGDLKSKKVASSIDCPKDITAWADPDMTKTILRNLLSNAIKFAPPGGKVGIKVSTVDNEVSISVSNTGKGITKEKIAQILSADIVEPEWGTSGEKGSGIGLALCRDFIARNYGRLEVEGSDSNGTTFTFTLPAHNTEKGNRRQETGGRKTEKADRRAETGKGKSNKRKA